MKAIIMKFGGTSVKDILAMLNVARIVFAMRAARTVVVVSAMAGVTDLLLAIADLATKRHKEAAHQLINELRAKHLAVCEGLAEGRRLAQLSQRVNEQIDQIETVVNALVITGGGSEVSRDALVARGEVLSSLLVTEALISVGIDAEWVDPRKVVATNSRAGSAQPDLAQLKYNVEMNLGPLLEGGKVPVTGGFVGAASNGVATTLGRGGSDYSASLIGWALEVDEIQIWTDVDGIQTTDPRLVPGAKTQQTLSYREASELASFGAKVLHPKSIKPAMDKGIPLLVLNSRNPEGAGTRVMAQPPGESCIKGIASRSVTAINVTSTEMLDAFGVLENIFTVFSKHETSVDVVATSEVSVSVTVDDDALCLDQIVADLERVGTVTLKKDCSVVGVVGDNLRANPRLMAEILNCVAEAGTPIEMVSHGGSANNLTFVCPRSHLKPTITLLHEHFFPSS